MPVTPQSQHLFPWKAHHNIGCNGTDRKPAADGCTEGSVFLCGIAAVHLFQGVVAATL